MMNIEPFLYPIFGGFLSVLGYFLRETMADMKKTKERLLDLKLEVGKNKSELEVLKNDHINKHDALNMRFDELKEVMKDLSHEIKSLTMEIAKRKD